MKLLIGTSNKGKIKEMSDALANLQMQIITPEMIDILEKPQETGTTYEENAVQKARFYFDLGKIPTLADDSGIVVDALQNELGIHTRRWGLGATVSDQDWIEFFLERMRQEDNRKARFLCTLAYIDANGDLHTFEGSCDGVITDELEAAYLPGLPISACFKPDGYDKVFSALSVEEKNQISHRGRALQNYTHYVQSSL
ncbi:non-canonical purine NTP pyrophosphatase [Candidatus Peribacteria bacterium]|nr:MAG: non-canonical purine NTP pyrophosphatase [Candidatus Peribacteria bacterium]